MSLQRGRITDLPSDAVVLSEDEALKYQANILNKWNQPRDIFGYKYGGFILGGASFLAGLYINSNFRRGFKLLHYGRAATYLPVCFLPATFSALTHMEFVLTDVVLQKTACPVCLEIRASALQATVGCVFPVILSSFANLSMAHKYATYSIPDIVTEPKKVFDLMRMKSGRVGNILFGIFVGQAVLGSLVTYLEANSITTVQAKLTLLEKELEEG